MTAVADIAAIFGDNLLRMRRGAGMSQDALALLCGIHRTEISQLERGLRVPRLDTFAKICSSLEVEPAELMAGIVWRSARIQSGSFDPGAENSS
jgi:transcriptional regulator with XRE-family HTH domain